MGIEGSTLGRVEIPKTYRKWQGYFRDGVTDEEVIDGYANSLKELLAEGKVTVIRDVFGPMCGHTFEGGGKCGTVSFRGYYVNSEKTDERTGEKV